MTNSTDTYWEIDGVSLQTHAFDIETIGDTRLAPPPLRGSNLVVPHAPGQLWLPKMVDSRVITLDMWVVGANEDGTIPSGSAFRKFDDNFRKLRQLLWTPNRQFTITKRFYVNGTLITASAKGQYNGGIAPQMTGRTRATFTVDILLADPYFYGEEVDIPAMSSSQVITVPGDDVTRAIKIHIDGARTNARVTNTTLGVYVENHAVLASGDKVDIDVQKFTSVSDPASLPPYNSAADVRHSGDDFWFLLTPGDNTVTVTSSSGTGGVTMSYQAVWL